MCKECWVHVGSQGKQATCPILGEAETPVLGGSSACHVFLLSVPAWVGPFLGCQCPVPVAHFKIVCCLTTPHLSPRLAPSIERSAGRRDAATSTSAVTAVGTMPLGEIVAKLLSTDQRANVAI